MTSASITPEMIQSVAQIIAGSRYWNCPDKTEVGVLARQALEAVEKIRLVDCIGKGPPVTPERVNPDLTSDYVERLKVYEKHRLMGWVPRYSTSTTSGGNPPGFPARTALFPR